jgi:hydrogenase expression/formation protein HypC
MCLAIPGRVVSVEGTSARVDFGGIQRKISLDLVPEATVGDYVLAHAGFAIQLLSLADAEETLDLLAQMEAAGGADP